MATAAGKSRKRRFRPEINEEPQNVSQEAGQNSWSGIMHSILGVASGFINGFAHKNSTGVADDSASFAASDGKIELEQTIKQMTFTRSEVEHLTEVLHSRICDDDVETSLEITPMASSPQHPTELLHSRDVLLKTFIRLKAKQLARMRRVCKYWNALISESSFVESHLHYSINNNDRVLLVFYSNLHLKRKQYAAYPCESPHIELPDFIKLPSVNPKPKKNSRIHVIGSVHGLICSHYGDGSVMHIWNPSLSAVLTLPPYSCSCGDDCYFGFGYDAKADDYKVLKLSSIRGAKIGSYKYVLKEWLQVEVYSMRKGCWQVITQRVPSHLASIGNGVGHEGRLHWFGDINKENLQTILAFDLGSETFREISFPDSVPVDKDRNDLGFVGGKLCVMSQTWEDEHQEWDVWVMEEYGVADSWVKKYVFCFPLYRGTRAIFYGSTPHDELIYKYADGYLLLYDPVADKAKIIDDGPPQWGSHRSVHSVVEHIDSLIWIAPPVK